MHRLDDLLSRRTQGEPIAYLTGKREFWSMMLNVAPGVLVPRPDSELLVEVALQHQSSIPDGPVADLGTGTGAIAIALATELPERNVVAVERQLTAIDIAKSNIHQFARNNIDLIQANWLGALADHSLAMIVANPPYLAMNDPHLSSLAHEPRDALVSGPQGLDDLSLIVEQSTRVAKPGAIVILEHGFEQGDAVRSLLHTWGFISIDTQQDLAGLDRVSSGYRPRD